jgi:hypothetical protein
MDILYQALRVPGAFFRYRVIGLGNIQHDGPAIYTANHWGALGPLPFFLSLPVRFYPWIKADLIDPRRSPHYLYREFVHPILHLRGRLGLAVAQVFSWISVPLIRQLGGIPVEDSTDWVGGTFRMSLALLAQDESLLIFPEGLQGEVDPVTMMRPFTCGFVQLCRMYQNATRRELPVYPTAVHPGRKIIAIDQAAFYRAQGDWRQDIRRFAEQMQERIRRLYLSVQLGAAIKRS